MNYVSCNLSYIVLHSIALTISPAAEDGVVRRSDGADGRAERRRAALVGRQPVVGLRARLGTRVGLGARLLRVYQI